MEVEASIGGKATEQLSYTGREGEPGRDGWRGRKEWRKTQEGREKRREGMEIEASIGGETYRYGGRIRKEWKERQAEMEGEAGRN